ncbi:hypothetical protein JYU34_009204 [Plutella xylostella]|uniref:Uncharacterized protein n=1 Tax=Plutella xylostella TaxID=51655 RepID=A0ABQ7QK52_PLUXY|nr:hypothetical protein JYU34_009204 [Plutella xylostella]
MRSYSVPVPRKCNRGKLGHESTFCLQRRRGWRRPEERSPSQPSDNFKRIPPPSTAKTAVTGFLCQGQGHYASSIRVPKASQTGPGCCQWRSEWIRCSQGEEGRSMRSERACWDVALIW